MFKKFTVEENVSSTSQIKNSVQRGIQAQIVSQYPKLEPIIEQLVPKKSMLVAKCQDHIQLVLINGEVMFFNQRDGPFFPTLKVLHKFPSMMPIMQVDKGAIKFVLSGANIMCPGFTSPGGSLSIEVDVEQPVAIFAEGKQHPLAIGLTKMSTSQIKDVNKGIAVENIHYLMDGLWLTPLIQ
jgi:malignant T-cell-amplified sequence